MQEWHPCGAYPSRGIRNHKDRVGKPADESNRRTLYPGPFGYREQDRAGHSDSPAGSISAHPVEDTRQGKQARGKERPRSFN